MKKSASFLKKRSKRLFLCWAWASAQPQPMPRVTEVFWFFFSKKNRFPYLLIRVRLEICSRLIPISANARSDSPASSAEAARSARQFCNRPITAETMLRWVFAPPTGACRVKIRSPNLPSDNAPETWLWLSLVMIRTFDLTNDGPAGTTKQHHFSALFSAFAVNLSEGRSWGRPALNAYIKA